MKLPIAIGKNSLGEKHLVDVITLPHLFISYEEDLQLESIFSSILGHLRANQLSLQLALSFGSKLSEMLLPFVEDNKIRAKFFHSDAPDVPIKTIHQFINTLTVELKKRKQLKKKRASIILEPLVAFIDDIFEVIRSPNKKTAFAFIELLALGSQQSIHFIAASSGIYKPLLNQLIHLNPGLIQRLNKANQEANFYKPLAAELVMNPDGLIFFKERNEYVFTRLYPFTDERVRSNY
jgi:hypothetical protein